MKQKTFCGRKRKQLMDATREAVTPESRTTNRAATPLLADSHSPRLLVVDDEVACRNVMKTMLAELGMSCKTASSAGEALTVLQNESMDAIIWERQPLVCARRWLWLTGADDGAVAHSPAAAGSVQAGGAHSVSPHVRPLGRAQCKPADLSASRRCRRVLRAGA